LQAVKEKWNVFGYVVEEGRCMESVYEKNIAVQNTPLEVEDRS
jgi:hypothetical protein